MALVSASQHLLVRSKKGAKYVCPMQMYMHGKGRHTHYCVVESFDNVFPQPCSRIA